MPDADPALPPDPVTALAEGANQLHELYLAYLKAGFPRRAALELVKTCLVTALQAGSESGGQ